MSDQGSEKESQKVEEVKLETGKKETSRLMEKGPRPIRRDAFSPHLEISKEVSTSQNQISEKPSTPQVESIAKNYARYNKVAEAEIEKIVNNKDMSSFVFLEQLTDEVSEDGQLHSHGTEKGLIESLTSGHKLDKIGDELVGLLQFAESFVKLNFFDVFKEGDFSVDKLNVIKDLAKIEKLHQVDEDTGLLDTLFITLSRLLSICNLFLYKGTKFYENLASNTLGGALARINHDGRISNIFNTILDRVQQEIHKRVKDAASTRETKEELEKEKRKIEISEEKLKKVSEGEALTNTIIEGMTFNKKMGFHEVIENEGRDLIIPLEELTQEHITTNSDNGSQA